MTFTPTPLTLLSEEEQMFKDSVRSFAHEVIRPLVHEMDQTSTLDPTLLKKLFEMGLMGIEIPERFGGTGSTFTTACLIIEELAAVDPAVSVVCDVQNTLVNNAVINFGNDAQKERYLTKLAGGTLGSYCLSEAGSGSDAFALKLRAHDEGDHWRLNGHKLWITNGKEAGLYIVFANINPELGYKGITAFLVERDFPGFSVGKKEDKLGIRASSTVTLNFEDCKVPKENVIGEIGKGYKIAIETLNEGRIGIGAQMLGCARGAFEYALNYVQERKQFGRALSDNQGLQFQLARCAVDIETARLAVYNAARLKDAGQPFVRQAAMAKLHASEVAERDPTMSVELLGGVGFTKEYPVEKYYRDAKIGKIYEGTSNMQLQTIAKMLLKDGL